MPSLRHMRSRNIGSDCVPGLVTTINGVNARYMVRESEENKINVVMAILLCAERNDSIIKSQLEAASL